MTLEEFLARWPWQEQSHATSEHWRQVLLHDVCVYCGDPPTGLDHIRPRSLAKRGMFGRHRLRKMLNSWENRAPACSKCDGWKGDLSLVFHLIRAIHCIRPKRFDRKPKTPRTRLWNTLLDKR